MLELFLTLVYYIHFLKRVTFPFWRASCACVVESCNMQRGIRVRLPFLCALRSSFFVYRTTFSRATALYSDWMIQMVPYVNQFYGIPLA